MLVVRCSLSVVCFFCCWLCVGGSWLLVVGGVLLFGVCRYSLFVVGCFVLLDVCFNVVVSFVLFVVCCLLFVDCFLFVDLLFRYLLLVVDCCLLLVFVGWWLLAKVCRVFVWNMCLQFVSKFVVCWLLCVVCWLLVVASCLLRRAVWCLLYAVRCCCVFIVVVCCLLFVVRCLSCAVVCYVLLVACF